jgi:hypothetical protein
VRFLLDINILVALAFPLHSSHQTAHSCSAGSATARGRHALFTQAGFRRVASRALLGTRDAVQQALTGLERDCRSPGHEFWPVDVDPGDLSDSPAVAPDRPQPGGGHATPPAGSPPPGPTCYF